MAYDAGYSSGLSYAPAARAVDRTAGYVTLGTRDLRRAVRFYDQIAREIGVGRSLESEDFVGWGIPGGAPGFGVALPDAVADTEPGKTGHGMMPLQAEDPEQVRRLFEIALNNGGSADGEPGDHGGGFYAAYFRDPDGNRLNAFCMSEH